MMSGPITSWQIDGEKTNKQKNNMETVRLYFLELQNHGRQ